MLDNPKWFSLGEAVEYTNISADALLLLVQEKRLRAYRLGRLWRFLLTDLNKCLAVIAGEEMRQHGVD